MTEIRLGIVWSMMSTTLWQAYIVFLGLELGKNSIQNSLKLV